MPFRWYIHNSVQAFQGVNIVSDGMAADDSNSRFSNRVRHFRQGLSNPQQPDSGMSAPLRQEPPNVVQVFPAEHLVSLVHHQDTVSRVQQGFKNVISQPWVFPTYQGTRFQPSFPEFRWTVDQVPFVVEIMFRVKDENPGFRFLTLNLWNYPFPGQIRFAASRRTHQPETPG